MIPVKTSITQIDTMPGEEIAFSIGDARWVMRTQADLYSNRELAVVREYSTNAADANKEAGNTSPIEVTLPSMMHPYFKVRDYGNGMSREVLAEVYTKFGESTKRDSDEFNGMLGYGCKSAVAYTDTFTVTSIHNGIKTIAVITRKPDWSIVMKIVSQQHTDEPSGVEVKVPVHNWEEFHHKAMDFYKFWLPGTVKVNGAEPVHHVGEKITDGLYFSHGSNWNAQSYVVMGNVPYRIENPSALFRNTNMRQINFVAYVPNGNVEFTPSREDLKYTEHTKKGLHAIIAEFEVKIVAQAKGEIAKAKTHAEAYAAWSKWCDVLGRQMFGDLTFKGDKFSDTFKVNGHRYQMNRYRNTTYSIDQYSVVNVKDTLFVTEFGVTVSSTSKLKSKEYADLMGWNVSNVIFTPATTASINSPWIDKTMFVTWENLKAAIPRKARQARHPVSGRLAGSYDYYTINGFTEGAVVPSDTKDVYYIAATVQRPKYDKRVDVAHLMTLAHMPATSVVVRLGENRMKKFKRENPTAKEFMSHLKTLFVKDGPSLLSDDAKRILDINYDCRNWVNALDASKLDDPVFAKYKALIRDEDKLTKAYNDNLALAQAFGMWYDVRKYNTTHTNVVSKLYPLLDSLNSRRVHPDIYLYLNAAYAARKDSK